MRTRIKGEQWFDVVGERYANACIAESMNAEKNSDKPPEGDRGWLLHHIYYRPILYSQPKKDKT